MREILSCSNLMDSFDVDKVNGQGSAIAGLFDLQAASIPIPLSSKIFNFFA